MARARALRIRQRYSFGEDILMDYRGAKYVNADRTRINCEVNHPKFGWIPVTITELDYPELWADVSTGPVSAYTDPERLP